MKAVKWIGIVLASLLAIFAVIRAVGARLPVEHRASVSATVAGDTDEVWRRIDGIDAWPTWRSVEVEILADDSVRVRESGETILYRLERPGARTLVTEIATPGLPYGGRWTWSVEPGSEGSSTVTITEDGEVYDPVFRFFSRYVFGHDGSIRRALEELQASFATSA